MQTYSDNPPHLLRYSRSITEEILWWENADHLPIILLKFTYAPRLCPAYKDNITRFIFGVWEQKCELLKSLQWLRIWHRLNQNNTKELTY